MSAVGGNLAQSLGNSGGRQTPRGEHSSPVVRFDEAPQDPERRGSTHTAQLPEEQVQRPLPPQAPAPAWREEAGRAFKESVQRPNSKKSSGVGQENIDRIRELLEKELAYDDLRKAAEEEPWKHWLVDSQPWSFMVNTLIIANSVQLGMCTRTHEESSNWGADWHFACDVMDQVFLAFFSFEAAMRILFYRLDYFSQPWHWLDIIVLLVGYGEILMQNGLRLNTFRTLRVLRVFRLLRLLRLFKDLWVIIEGLLASLKPTIWICLLMFMELYVFSLVCVDMVGNAGADVYPGFSAEEAVILSSENIMDFNNFQYFGTIPRSMYTLFNVVIGAEWPEIGRAIWERQPLIFALFALFIICTMFGLMNVLIGVIVDNTKSAQHRLEKEDMVRNRARKAKCLGQLCDFVFSLDVDRDSTVTLNDIIRGFEKKDIQPLLSMMDLPHGFTGEELFHLFNFNGGDEIQDMEFVTQAYRLIYGSSVHHQYQLMSGVNEIKASLAKITTRQQEIERRLQEVQDEQAAIRQEALPLQSGQAQLGEEPRPARQPQGAAEKRGSGAEEPPAPRQLARQLEELVAASQSVLSQIAPVPRSSNHQELERVVENLTAWEWQRSLGGRELPPQRPAKRTALLWPSAPGSGEASSRAARRNASLRIAAAALGGHPLEPDESPPELPDAMEPSGSEPTTAHRRSMLPLFMRRSRSTPR